MKIIFGFALAVVGFCSQSVAALDENKSADGLFVHVAETPKKGLWKVEMNEQQVADFVAGLEKNFAAEAEKKGQAIHTKIYEIDARKIGSVTAGNATKYDTYVGSNVRMSVVTGVARNKWVQVFCIAETVENARFFNTLCGRRAQEAFGDVRLHFKESD